MGLVRAPLLLNEPSGDVTAGSLKIKSGSYLSRTFGTGNSTTWTFSCWSKRGALGTTQYLFRTPNVDEGFYFSTSDKIDIYRYSGSFTYFGTSPAVLRDTTGWQHIVYAHDSTRESGRRLRLYINGVLQEKLDSLTDIGSGSNYSLNSAVAHRVGEIDGYMAQCYFIDGLALPPFLFGFTDPLTNTWKPRRFREKGLPTVNDGTSWTSDLTTDNGTSWFGGSAAANVFDGTTSTFVQGALNYDVTFAPTTPIPVNLKLRIWADGGSGFGIGNGPYKITYNGTEIYNERMWESPFEVEAAPGTLLTSLKIEKVGSGEAMRLYAIEVDGVIMKNSTTKSFDFGTNGFYLPMDDEERFHLDQSGNNNHFTKTNFSGTSVDPDVIKDSPSAAVSGGRGQTGITTTSSAPSNYPTLNPSTNINSTISEGNLKVISSTDGQYALAPATTLIKTGKHYWEMKFAIGSADAMYCTAGICSERRKIDGNNGQNTYSDAGDYGFKGYIGGFRTMTNQTITYNNGSNHGTTLANNDTIQVAFDADAGKLWFGINGTYLTNSAGVGNPSLNLNPDLSGIPTDIGHFPAFGPYATGGNSSELHVNFGQKPFKYVPPKGFLPFNTASIPPVKVISRPDKYVGIVTYKGDASIDQIISSDKIRVTRGSKKPAAFNPDWIWIADRFTNGGAKWLFDSVRGSDKYLQTSSNGGEGTRSFTINNSGVRIPSSDGSYNLSNSKDYFAMYLKAGGSSNTFNVDDVGYSSASDAGLTSGDVTPSGASVGTKQGFSIIKFNSGTAGTKTIPHGLLETPAFILVKTTGTTSDWSVYHKGAGATVNDYLVLNTNAGTATASNIWGSALPTSSVFGIKSGTTCASSQDVIAYCWHDVPGLQKFGNFKGSSTANPVDYVHLGFKPAVVWLKRVDNSGKWPVYDMEKNKFNTSFNHNFLNENTDEQQAATNDGIDILSNGFAIRSGANYRNAADSQYYIYCAWAAAPESNLFGGQSNGY